MAHQISKRFITNYHLQQIKYFSSFKQVDPEHIRNFSIIAHVDHGKSTLADRLIETGCSIKDIKPQVLDNLQVERERGITVKAQTVALNYTCKGIRYLLNLIDTPGHVDFNHEVGRSLSISDGVLLLVDATQGIQAQTVSNFYSAFENELDIIGVINKIDSPNADVLSCQNQMSNLFDLKIDDILLVSAKTGQNVSSLFPRIVEDIRPPSCSPLHPLQALLHDFKPINDDKGIMMLTVYIKNGALLPTDKISFLSTGITVDIKEIGMFNPYPTPVKHLSAGSVGYITVQVKNLDEITVGDTLHKAGNPTPPLLHLHGVPRPTVFAGLFPDSENDFRSLSAALDNLCRTDTSVDLSPDSNITLGKGWRLGFLGTLHMEVFVQRLAQEYAAEVVLTPPSVTYRALLKKDGGGTVVEFNTAPNMPHPNTVHGYEEPIVRTTLITPAQHLSTLITLCMGRRGHQVEVSNLDEQRFLLVYDIPLAETMLDFYSQVKQVSSGYASCTFEPHGYQPVELTRVDVLVNGTLVEGLSAVVRTPDIRDYGKRTVTRLAGLIPSQIFMIAVQCVVGGKVIARANVRAKRKDVTKDLYGGDKTRAMKLLRQQAEGKKAMRKVGKVEIPREVFRMRLDL